MDRSFLSQAEVVAAARKFVCIRLATYEDQQEAEFLKQLFLGRSGELENTVFAVLSPDGQRQLVRASRSPVRALPTAGQLADTLSRIAGQHQTRKSAAEPSLPKAANVRLALDIAACDNRPLAVLYAQDAAALRLLEDRLRQLAWCDDFVGQLVYAATTEIEQLKPIEGVAPGSSLIIIQPDRFGLKGTALAQAGANAALLEWKRALHQGIELDQRIDKTLPMHVRDGHRNGIFWETRIPVTDPLEKRAREKGQNPPPPS